jgi:hypothetical protein
MVAAQTSRDKYRCVHVSFPSFPRRAVVSQPGQSVEATCPPFPLSPFSPLLQTGAACSNGTYGPKEGIKDTPTSSGRICAYCHRGRPHGEGGGLTYPRSSTSPAAPHRSGCGTCYMHQLKKPTSALLVWGGLTWAKGLTNSWCIRKNGKGFDLDESICGDAASTGKLSSTANM